MHVEFTPEARGDFFDIARFIAADNPARAATFIDEIEATIFKLAEMPERYPIVIRSGRHAIRRMPYRTYAVFYRADHVGILILRIVHGARVTGDFLDDLG